MTVNRNHEDFQSVQLEALRNAVEGKGVVAPNDFDVSIGSGDMDVNVSAGAVRYDGVRYSNAATATLTLSASDDTFDRFDAVVYDTSADALDVREGTPSGGAPIPDLNAGDVLIAVVYVPADSVYLQSGNVVDASEAAAVPAADALETVSTTANLTTAGESAVLADTSGGALTVTLASADAYEGNEVVVKDIGGSAGTNAISVATEGSETIDGATSDSIASNYGKLRLVSDGSNWFVA